MILVDKLGRRPLILCSLLGSCIFLGLLGGAFFTAGSNVGLFALIGMCAYLFSFGIGLAPVPWLINAEIYPLEVRGVANSVATATNWVANFLVAATFLDISRALSTDPACPDAHPDGAFWLYGGAAFAGFIWLAIVMPETRGKTLEQMDALFK